MKKLSKLKDRFMKLSRADKIQLVIASFLTFVLVAGLPAFAWFSAGKKLEAFTKIKQPDNLDIRAGHYDPVQYFDLSDIDIKKIAGEDGEPATPHRVVFSVSAGDYKIPYKLQLAHTTNNPFKYRIFRATEYTITTEGTSETETATEADVTYISVPLKNQDKPADEYTFYYVKGEEVTLTAKNADPYSSGKYGRQIASGSGSYYGKSYDEDNEDTADFEGDTPEIYAVPIYEQSGKIPPDKDSEHDYFILEISYDETAATSGNFSEWNLAENKNETDMVYITASRFTT